jgi:rfaE bifunctional protein kinase chain/domain
MGEVATPGILERLAGSRILIAGDVMLDEYVWGEADRVCPEAPVPVVDISHRSHSPGGAGNVAANVKALGGVPLLGGVVGADPQADQLREALHRGGVTHRLAVDAARPTTTKTRVMARGRQIVRLDSERKAPYPADIEEDLLRWVEENATACDALVLSDYAKGLVSSPFARRFIDAARRAGKPVLVDPKGDDFQKYRGATLVKPNSHEVERFLGTRLDGDGALRRSGADLVTALGGNAVLVTRGARGMTLFRADREPLHVSATARKVFDVTGAGDTVAAALAVALAAGATLEEAAVFANRAAAVAVGKVGTACVTPGELDGGVD